SADEFAMALRAALGGDVIDADGSGPPWPVKGIGATAYALKKAIDDLRAGSVRGITGPEGAGCSTLLRRVAWELSLAERTVLIIDEDSLQGEWAAQELSAARGSELLWFFDSVSRKHDAELARLVSDGARLVRPMGQSCEHEFAI